jgi:hypothetical protein
MYPSSLLVVLLEEIGRVQMLVHVQTLVHRGQVHAGLLKQTLCSTARKDEQMEE